MRWRWRWRGGGVIGDEVYVGAESCFSGGMLVEAALVVVPAGPEDGDDDDGEDGTDGEEAFHRQEQDTAFSF